MVALLKMPLPLTSTLSGQAHSAEAASTWTAPAAEPQWAERRAFPRKQISARIESKRLDHTLPALREPHVAMALRDLSIGGLSAISPLPLAHGERLTVSFPPQTIGDGQLRGGWDAVGRVVRCQPSVLGYRVAVEFEAMPMAA
jgi:hypothetical protein